MLPTGKKKKKKSAQEIGFTWKTAVEKNRKV